MKLKVHNSLLEENPSHLRLSQFIEVRVSHFTYILEVNNFSFHWNHDDENFVVFSNDYENGCHQWSEMKFK